MEALSFQEDREFCDNVLYLGLDIDRSHLENGAVNLLQIRHPEKAANFQTRVFDLRTKGLYPMPENFPEKPNIILARSPNLLSAEEAWLNALTNAQANLAENGLVIIITDNEGYWDAFSRRTSIEEVLQREYEVDKRKKGEFFLNPGIETSAAHSESYIIILKPKPSS
jgi:hypothetical protein